MKYKNEAQVNKEFDEKFKDIVNSGYWWRLCEEIKLHITSLRISDLQSIREWAEEKLKEPTMLEKGLPTTDFCHSDYDLEREFRNGMREVLAHLSTLSSSSEKGTPPNEIKE